MRRFAVSRITSVSSKSMALTTTCARSMGSVPPPSAVVPQCDCINLLGHLGDVFAVPALGTFMYGPLGTVAWMVVAYNVSVSGASHISYPLDMLARDYIQDHVLYVALRYAVTLALICTIAQLMLEP
eukprot:PhM_4_TR13231/c0_g1_i1/m.36193